jgi:hypothetical protein
MIRMWKAIKSIMENICLIAGSSFFLYLTIFCHLWLLDIDFYTCELLIEVAQERSDRGLFK